MMKLPINYFQAIQRLSLYIVSAQGNETDFLSRFFVPQAGVPEAPVTGSAHTTLILYWSKRLGKSYYLI